MRTIFRASSARPVSNASVLLSSSPHSPHAPISAQRAVELDNLRTKLDWYQNLFSQLDADAMKHEADLEQLEALCASQAQQIDTQQSQLRRLHSDKDRLEFRVAELQDHLRTQALVHEQAVEIAEAEHDAEFELMREDISRERERVEKKWFGKSSVRSRSAGAECPIQNEQLREAITYTELLASSGRVHRIGLEVELHHLRVLCQLAKAQEEVIAKLRVSNAQLPPAAQVPAERDSEGKNLETGTREVFRRRARLMGEWNKLGAVNKECSSYNQVR